MVKKLVNCLCVGCSVLVISTTNCQQKIENVIMPYINIKITKEGATSQQKAELIEGVTLLLQNVLGKNRATTVVIIDEVETDNWGIAGEQVTARRKREN